MLDDFCVVRTIWWRQISRFVKGVLPREGRQVPDWIAEITYLGTIHPEEYGGEF